MFFRKLDRYILTKFIQAIFVALIAVILIYITIDLFDNLNKYLDAKTPVIGYVILYTLRIPEIISQVFPIVVFLSMLFTLGSFAKSNEITAMKAAGISLFRISLPLIIFGVFLSIFHFGFSEILLPISSRKYYESRAHYLKKKSRLKRVKDEIAYQEEHKIIYIKRFLQSKNLALDVSIQKIFDGKICYRIDAKEMHYQNKKWFLTNAIKRTFTNDSLIYQNIDTLLVNLDVLPKEIGEIALKPIEMGWFELRDYINKKEKLGVKMVKWEVEMNAKIAYSAVIVIMLLIGIPFSTGSLRSSASINFGLSVAIAFIFYLIIIVFKNWGQVGDIPPLVAAWTPNMIFLTFALILFYRSKY